MCCFIYYRCTLITDKVRKRRPSPPFNEKPHGLLWNISDTCKPYETYFLQSPHDLQPSRRRTSSHSDRQNTSQVVSPVVPPAFGSNPAAKFVDLLPSRSVAKSAHGADLLTHRNQVVTHQTRRLLEP